ncbi:hypothetical protein V8C35DRAFT_294398 [Trichoderma chlorosporum]
MKYNTATVFAAAAALVSVTSASESAFCASGACPVLPVQPGRSLGGKPPCVEVSFKEDQCSLQPFLPSSVSSSVSNAFVAAFDACNCAANQTFSEWLQCQSCLLEQDLYQDVSQIWLRILGRAKSVLCNLPFPSPTQTGIAAPTQTDTGALAPTQTNTGLFTPTQTNTGIAAPTQTDTQTDTGVVPTATPTATATATAPLSMAVAAESCDEAPQQVNKQQEIIQSASSHLPPVTTALGASIAIPSLGKSGLALAIVGGIILGVL